MLAEQNTSAALLEIELPLPWPLIGRRQWLGSVTELQVQHMTSTLHLKLFSWILPRSLSEMQASGAWGYCMP